MIRTIGLTAALACLAQAAIAGQTAGAPGTQAFMSGLNNGRVAKALPTRDYLSAVMRDDAFTRAEAQLAVEKARSPRVRAYGQSVLASAGRSEDLIRAAAQTAPADATPTPLQQAMLDKLRGADGAEFDRLYLRQQYAEGALMWQAHRNYQYTGEEKPLRGVAARYVPLTERRMQALGDMESLAN